VRIKLSIKLGGFIGLMVFTALLTAAAAAQTSSPDVGLITKLDGSATFWNKAENQKPAKVEAFMKVRRGDCLKLPAAASVTLLYFASGRQETWKGPVTLQAGDTKSTAVGNQKTLVQPVVKTFPAQATRQMAGAPLKLCPSSTSASGVIQTMGARCEPATKTAAKAAAPLSAQAQRQIAAAQRVYRDLQRLAAPDDITPELYFLGVLAKYKQYPEMIKVANAMLAKRPSDPSVLDLQTWVRSQALAGAQP
jgi:hypothetical protein